MRSGRRRLTNAVIAVAILVAGSALAFAGWRSALRAQPTDEALTRRLARNVVRCDLAIGRSVPEVRALLGRPDASEFFERSGRRLGWFSYVVGVNDSDNVHLYIEFEHPPRELRQRSGAAPQRLRGGPADRHAAGGGCYSTVTVFARLRGWSTFSPRLRAT